MAMNQPLVSVVIPFYSGKNWLLEAVDSVLSQTYTNFEVLIVNDGSLESIDDIAEKYGRLNLKIFYKENGGPASARNLGIEKSSGKYIAFLDSDDIWLPDKLYRQINLMESKNIIWSQHSYEMFWEDSDRTKIIDTKIYSGNVYKDCFISFKIQTSCVVVLREVLIKENIRFPLHKRYGEDGDFYKQLAKKYSLEYIDGVLSKFRIRGSNAGFKAEIQINDKATTWKEINEDKNILDELPSSIIFAFKISVKLSAILSHIKRKIKNEAIIESIAKLLYTFPYLIFKIRYKKIKR